MYVCKHNNMFQLHMAVPTRISKADLWQQELIVLKMSYLKKPSAKFVYTTTRDIEEHCILATA
jgi:hypothetical protein